ncbi:Alpha/Beta hydrolase protein [Bombardia bombarda]|uniref:Alpha/Beta hydrolase protein n=1 Tax=Bombardia bombarda TaxID=252184 RepID=A0AA39XK76_9PEZI|nr:Alpha/Beta hydrolase protein [Bombardia bombarda]
MAELEVATKAPESDALEDTTAAATTETSQTSPAVDTPPTPMGDHCTRDRPTPTGQASTGEITKLGGVDVYISKPSDYPHTPSRFLLLLTGGTGLLSVNNQIQADNFAAEGYVVVMPDLFEGEPAPNSSSNPSQEEQSSGSSLLDAFKTKAAEAAKSFLIDMWLARHTAAKVMPLLHKVLDASKDEFADAVSNGGGVYAVGYCFGARYILLLAAERSAAQQQQGGRLPWAKEEQRDVEAGKPAMLGPYIKAGALAHPTLVSRDDFVGLKAPVSIVAVESDPLFPDEVRTAGEDYMTKNNVEHEVQVYPGVPHGFAVVGDYDDAQIKSAQETAFDQMLKWIQEH